MNLQKIGTIGIVLIGYFIFPIFFGYFLYYFQTECFSLVKKNIDSNIIIYDSHNKILKKYDTNVIFNKIPKYLFYAFMAIEDATFLDHYGISIKSIIRSIITNIKKKKFAQGGSTITQQYIKLYYGDLKKTFYRKIKEILLAIMIEFFHSKETIFESYCNVLYFGKNITGVANCAQILFNKEYTNLTIDESAMLAGIIQRPEYYNPSINFELAIKRRNLVLKRMYKEGYITQNEYKKNIKKKTIINYNKCQNPHGAIYRITRQTLHQMNFPLQYEYELATTINEKIQKTTYMIFNKHIQNMKKKYKNIDGSVIIIDIEKGSIVAMIDGYDNHQGNQSPFYWKKQIGSIIKPLIIYFALINGDTINTIYCDEPLDKNIFNWNPKNPYNKFLGLIPLKIVLIRSNNIIPIKILQKFGIKEFLKITQPFFQYKIPFYYSIALGCIESNILEIANLYYTFFNSTINNNEKNIHYINKIIKNCGGIIYENNDFSKPSSFVQAYTQEILKPLQEIGNRLAKKHNIKFDTPIYIKTGTTNNAVSCWCICATKKYLVVNCIGTPENTKLFPQYSILGSNSAAPLCLQIMNNIYKLNQDE